jgi:uncharacterized protein YegL
MSDLDWSDWSYFERHDRRWALPLFFVIEASGGMYREMSDVSAAIEKTVFAVQARYNDEFFYQTRIKIAVLAYSDTAVWHIKPIEIEDFQWTELQAGGLACFGAACEELNGKLTRKEFMCDSDVYHTSVYYPPVIMLISKREPTDNYQDALARLHGNNWFKYSLKAAFGIGKDNESLRTMFTEFTGTPETIVLVDDGADFEKCLGRLALEAIVTVLEHTEDNIHNQAIFIERIGKLI